jgi:hypothetical protein
MGQTAVVNWAWTDAIYKENDGYILMATSDRSGVPASEITMPAWMR